MKLIAKTFCVALLLPLSNCIAQQDVVFFSLESAAAVHPDSVFQLNLSKKKLREFPQEVLNYKNLTVLNLSKNKLTALPDQFAFPQLTELDLSKNNFTEFPNVICNSSKMKNLLMSRNKLTDLPECIGNLKQLENLDLWFNLISVLPESLTQLRKLKTLDLRGMNYNDEFQKIWKSKLPWVAIEFNIGCDC